jgi:hypothetical protein
VVTFPLAAPEALGILGTAAAWSAIGAGTQTVIEAAGMPYREQIAPGYMESGQPLANIGGAALIAGGIGGGLRAGAAAWDALKGRAWPRAIRDAGNVVESEGNIAATNLFADAGGEIMHREALSKAIDDIAAGRRIDLGEAGASGLAEAYAVRFTPVIDAIDRARSTKAVEDVGDVAFELQGIARSSGYSMTRAEADQLAERMMTGSQDEAGAILDELALRPRTLLDTLPDEIASTTNVIEPSPIYREPLAQQLRQPASDADEALLRNLDRLRLDRPELEIPFGETLDPDGRAIPLMRRVDDVLAEADARQSAAKEILDCVGGYQEAAE